MTARSRRGIRTFLLALSLALALAVAASAFALLGPTGRYEQGGEEAVREGAPRAPRDPVVTDTGWTTLLGQIRAGEEDASVLVWLVVPIVVALVPLVLARSRLALAASGVAAFLLLAFAFLAGFSIGLFYVPSALAMVAATIAGTRARDAHLVGRERRLR